MLLCELLLQGNPLSQVFGDRCSAEVRENGLCGAGTIRTFYFKWSTLLAHITVELLSWADTLFSLYIWESLPSFSCTFYVETNNKKRKLQDDRAKSCWITRHHLMHMRPPHGPFALCGRGWVWKLGRCRSQACADKYFREKTSPRLSASVHSAPVPHTRSRLQYRHK